MPTNPLTAAEVLDRMFLDVRCRLLDVAATLDRLHRSPGAEGLVNERRMQQIREAIDGKPRHEVNASTPIPEDPDRDYRVQKAELSPPATLAEPPAQTVAGAPPAAVAAESQPARKAGEA